MATRVIPAALANYAQWYPGDEVHGNSFPEALKLNRGWIQAMMDQGRHIIDIGIDRSRDRADASDFYQMERDEITARGYSNVEDQSKRWYEFSW